MKTKPKLISLRGEVTYTCPFCGSCFTGKSVIKPHLYECASRYFYNTGGKDIKIKVKLLKPKL